LKKVIVAALAAGFIGSAAAAQHSGVEVYPAAKPAPEVAKVLKESMKLDAGTFITSDSVEKVTAFYKGQKGLTEQPGTSKQGAMFMGKGVMLTIQNPWLDMKTSQKQTSTLISIVKQK